MRSNHLKVFVSPTGWVEVHNQLNKETHLQSFYNLKKVIEAEGFLVIELNSGRIEIYDQQLNLLSHHVFENVSNISAEKDICIKFDNGDEQLFDKQFQPLEIKKTG